MRKNTARHWLHAGLDLLPLILIPVFMIYSHRHTIDSGSIEVPVNKVVDFNQLQIVPTSTSYFYANNVESFSFDDGEGAFKVVESGGNINTIGNPVVTDYSHKYYVCLDLKRSSQYVYLNYHGVNYGTSQLNVYERVGFISYQYDSTYFYLIDRSTDTFSTTYFKNLMVFDLSQMFGVGNEPTIEQFNQWYSNDYYDYVLSRKELLKGYSTETYDDSDIMSQFTYQLYNSVDKYFNMGNVFGMSNVYDWFNLNIFGGNASISIYIVWNIVLYEFVMDLLFLLYALFMWFIDVTKRLIERPLDSIK